MLNLLKLLKWSFFQKKFKNAQKLLAEKELEIKTLESALEVTLKEKVSNENPKKKNVEEEDDFDTPNAKKMKHSKKGFIEFTTKDQT